MKKCDGWNVFKMAFSVFFGALLGNYFFGNMDDGKMLEIVLFLTLVAFAYFIREDKNNSQTLLAVGVGSMIDIFLFQHHTFFIVEMLGIGTAMFGAYMISKSENIGNSETRLKIVGSVLLFSAIVSVLYNLMTLNIPMFYNFILTGFVSVLGTILFVALYSKTNFGKIFPRNIDVSVKQDIE